MLINISTTIQVGVSESRFIYLYTNPQPEFPILTAPLFLADGRVLNKSDLVGNNIYQISSNIQAVNLTDWAFYFNIKKLSTSGSTLITQAATTNTPIELLAGTGIGNIAMSAPSENQSLATITINADDLNYPKPAIARPSYLGYELWAYLPIGLNHLLESGSFQFNYG